MDKIGKKKTITVNLINCNNCDKFNYLNSLFTFFISHGCLVQIPFLSIMNYINTSNFYSNIINGFSKFIKAFVTDILIYELLTNI